VKRPPDRPSGPKALNSASASKRIESIIEGAEKAAEKVIDDAEKQARAYVAEAEAEADRAAAERLTAAGELAEALLKQADAIRRQAELLADSLREARNQFGEGEEEAARADLREVGSMPPPSEIGAAQQADDEPNPENGAGPAAGLADVAADTEDADRRETGSVGAGWRLRHEAAEAGPRLAAVDPVVPTLEPVGDPVAPPAEPVRPRGGSPAGARLLATQMAVSGSSREEIAERLRSGFEIEDTDAILDAILGPNG
jgi:vacuolar-type H+-ATPase subunit H